MRVLFISANTERINMPVLPFGLGCVAEATRRAGHEIKLVDLLGIENVLPVLDASIEELSPEAIAISVRNIDDQKSGDTRFLLNEVKELIAHCRDITEAPIVLGGAGYSIAPAAALEYLEADMGIQGEGEVAFLELLDRIRDGSDLSGIPGLYVRGRGLQGERVFADKLDELPLPETDLWSHGYVDDPEAWMPIQTRRGCSMDCSYCSTATIEGKTLRKRSPDAVVEWMARHAGAGFKHFFFTDNTFNLPASYAIDLCRRMSARKLGVSWKCIVYPVRLSEELAESMAKSGCVEVSLGSESGNEDMLRSMNKRFKPDDVRQVSDVLAANGIRRMGFLLLGGPGETKESVEESFAFTDSLNLDMVKINIGIRIYPETALAKTSVKEGVISPDDDLLSPKFYIQAGLEAWLRETVGTWLAERPNWFM